MNATLESEIQRAAVLMFSFSHILTPIAWSAPSLAKASSHAGEEAQLSHKALATPDHAQDRFSRLERSHSFSSIGDPEGAGSVQASVLPTTFGIAIGATRRVKPRSSQLILEHTAVRKPIKQRSRIQALLVDIRS